MKYASLCLLLGIAAVSVAMAQEAPVRALRPPNVPNAAGTDSGQGPACDQLTTYGQLQPQGPDTKPYGAAATSDVTPAPAPAPAPVPDAATAGRRGGAGTRASTLGAAGAATRGIVVPDTPQLPYHFVEPPQPARGTNGFANVNGVGLLKNGHLIVNQRLPMYQVLEYDADNRLLHNIDPNIVSRSHGMRIDNDDNIWITDQQCNIVVKMSPGGDMLMVLGTSGKTGTWDEAKGDHLFNQPTDVAFGKNGDIFVSTGHGGPDPRVVRFDKNGKFITTWSLAHSDGTAAVVHTVVVDSKNQVYVGDRDAKMIRVFDVTGKPVRDIPMKNLVGGLYIDAKNQLWMTTGQEGMVMKLDWNGKILGWIGKEGFGNNDFGEAHYMTVTPDGKTIYVSDNLNNNIKKLVAN